MRKEGFDGERNRELKLWTYPCPGYRLGVYIHLSQILPVVTFVENRECAKN